MCTRAWCFGECEECITEAKQREYDDKYGNECPFTENCNFSTLNIKTDICKTCGRTQNY